MRNSIFHQKSALVLFLFWAAGVSCALAESIQLYRYVQTQPEMNWAFDVQEELSVCTITFLDSGFTLEKSDDHTTITTPGTTAWTKAGEPKLPVFVALMEIGEGVHYSIEVITGDEKLEKVGYLEPVPAVGTVSTGDNEYEIVEEKKADAAIYAKDTFWPETLYSIDEAKGAGRRYLRIGMNTFQYNPATQLLRHYPNMQLVVRFTPAGQGES